MPKRILKTSILKEKPNPVKKVLSLVICTIHVKVTNMCLLLHLFSAIIRAKKHAARKTTNRPLGIKIYGKPNVAYLLAKEKEILIFRIEIQIFRNQSD